MKDQSHFINYIVLLGSFSNTGRCYSHSISIKLLDELVVNITALEWSLKHNRDKWIQYNYFHKRKRKGKKKLEIDII